MKFLFDQSADFRLIPHLRSLDHDVQAISREYPAGLADEDVLTIACDEHRILITTDHDFGDLVFRKHLRHTGIILMRLPGAPLQTKLDCLTKALAEYSEYLEHFLVVTERSVRVRRVEQP